MSEQQLGVDLWRVDVTETRETTFYVTARTRDEAREHADALMPLNADEWDHFDRDFDVYAADPDAGVESDAPVWHGGKGGGWLTVGELPEEARE